MKKVCSVLLSCTILASSFSITDTSLAINEKIEVSNQYLNENDEEEIEHTYSEVKINDIKLKLKNVNVNFNENPIVSDVPAVLFEERTMVPLRVIAESTGAEVEWHKESKGITVKTKEKTIYLEIDSNKALINGMAKSIDYGVPPKLINSTTMVPLRFITEEIGCEVEWDEKTFTADISYNQLGSSLNLVEVADITSSLEGESLSSLTVSLSSSSSPKVYMPSEDQKKIIIDIPNSALKINGEERRHFETYLGKSPVDSVVATQIDKRNVRVIVNLSSYTEFDSSFNGRDINISFPAAPVESEPSSPSISANTLAKFSVENINGREAILLHNASEVDYKDFKLSGNPARVVLDLKNTILNTSDSVINTETVSGIRFSQYENPAEYAKGELVTRVVLDLARGLDKFNYETEKIGSNIAIFINSEAVSIPPATPDSNNQNDSTVNYTNYNMTLDEMVSGQLNRLTVTDKYRNSPAYVHKSLISTVDGKFGKIIENKTFVRSDANILSFAYGQLNEGAFVTILDSSSDWYQIKYNTWRNASPEDIRYYLDPNNFSVESASGFQFLDLSKTSGISSSELNSKVLVNKGTLSQTGDAFIEAGRRYGINEIYLVAHAFLETGHGSSQLAKGVKVSSVDGKPVEPRIVYNMFGIGATDANALKYGSEKAYKEGWFSPEEAIIGGAKFIAEKYVNNGQNTLYEMRWNPDINRIWHQYATDIGWSYKQINSMKSLYDLCSGYTLKYDIPVYKR